jgi:tetratricopeptide (TPR) repeat protein
MLALLLFAALLLAYYPALRGGFLWDDDTYISANPTLLTLAGLRAIWLDPSATCQYYPLSFPFFWAIYQLCGLNPLGFHLATLLLHGVAAILFWQVLVRLRVRGALLAAAIFALHPANVMSVAWMTELKNTLSASLALGAAWAYIRFAGLGVYESASPKEKAWRWYALSLGLFLLAMLAKTAVSFLPATLVLVVWWQRQRITRRDILSLIPMLGISLGMGALTIYIERHAGGASGADFTIGFLDRVLISGRSFWFYLGKLLWPSHLTFIYPRWKLDTAASWQWLYPAATFALLSATWMARRRLGKGPFLALMHFYVSTSLLILAVVLYMMRYSFVADHWQYFGSLSIIALAASGITRALDRLGPRGRPFAIGLELGLVLGLGMLTRAQTRMYSDIETLWRTTIARNPDCSMAYDNLGAVLLQQGRVEEAIADAREALRINPDFAEAHGDLANDLIQQGRIEQAIAEFRKAIQINPAYATAHSNLGNALLQQGRTGDAIAEYREALRIDPTIATADYDLGNALLQQGRTDDAIAAYREALRVNPALAEARANLGNALIRQGRTDDAIAEFRRATQINPTDAKARYNLGNALLQQGGAEEAIAQFRDALRINPAFAEAHGNLGVALLQQGQTEDAIAQLREAVRINPAYAEAHYNLGNALLRDGQAAEAIPQIQKALELQPANLAIQNTLAWILATASQPSLRDGPRAVELAAQASQAAAGSNPVILRTLAAAYAQAGQFPNAVQTAQKALQLAPAQSNANLANALLREIKLYEAAQPFRETP